MEMIDVLDEKGDFTGKTETRTKVHELGLWHRTVYIWVMNLSKELLMQKRSPNKEKNPNKWTISTARTLVSR